MKPFLITLTLLFATVLVGTVAAASTQCVRLKDAARITGSQILLSDVAELHGQVAEALGDVVVAQFDGQSQIKVGLDTVREKLEDRGVNWGRLALGGYLTCEVQIQVPSEPIVEPKVDVEHSDVVAANIIDSLTVHPATTLRDRLIELIERFSGVSRNELRITFSPRDRKRLDETESTDRFEFEPIARVNLGRVPIKINRYRDGQIVERQVINVDVARRMSVVVAKRTLRHGQTIAPDDVEVREIWIDSVHGDPTSQLDAVIGQTANTFLRANSVVFAQDIRSPTLVRRGETITVRCVSRDFVIKTVARALEDGVRDQFITVRNQRAHRRDRRSTATYIVRVTGRQEAMRILDENRNDT